MACCIFRQFLEFFTGRRSQKMTTNPKAEEHSQGTDNEQEPKPVAVGWLPKIEDVEAYPYELVPYIVVCGGLTYRWRVLRKMKDRVRAYQDKIQKQYEAGRPVKYGSSEPPSADKVDR